MYNRIILTITVVSFLFFKSSFAQQSALKLTAEAPIQFGFGFEGKISQHFSATISAGLLTPPNSTLIVNVLEVLGTDEQITLMINDAFKFGFVGKSGLNYNFKKNYVGGFIQLIALQAGDTPTELVESYFGTSISSYPSRRGKTTTEKYLHLSSTLYQAGVLYGHRFLLKNKQFEIDAEIGMSANIGSTSKLTSDVRDLTTLSKVADEELAGYYSDYAFIPSASIAFVYRFRK
jgi:hypothetical protein